MRKRDFDLYKNKDTDQLHSNRKADQRLYFHYTDSTFALVFKLLPIFQGCTGRFMSDLVGNPENRFSRFMAAIVLVKTKNVVALSPH